MGLVAILVRLVKLTNNLLYYSLFSRLGWVGSLQDAILLAILMRYNKDLRWLHLGALVV
jgi:hypothetical protein